MLSFQHLCVLHILDIQILFSFSTTCAGIAKEGILIYSYSINKTLRNYY